MSTEPISDRFTLSPDYSTTRLVTQKPPFIEEPPNATFKTILFPPEGKGRQGEGGLRTQGYFKRNLPNKPLITVITVVFNAAAYLEETILSIIRQIYDNIEYVIIDGGSTDGTLDVIRKYEHAIDYWVSEKDEGIYDAMNKGIDLSSGTWINFINVGDLLINTPSSEQFDPDFDLIVGNVALKSNIKKLFYPTFNNLIKIRNTLHHQGVFYKKDIIGHYSLKYKVFSDFDKNQELYKRKCRAKILGIYISEHSQNGVSNSKQYYHENYDIIKSNFDPKYALLSFLYFKVRGIKYAILNIISHF